MWWTMRRKQNLRRQPVIRWLIADLVYFDKERNDTFIHFDRVPYLAHWGVLNIASAKEMMRSTNDWVVRRHDSVPTNLEDFLTTHK